MENITTLELSVRDENENLNEKPFRVEGVTGDVILLKDYNKVGDGILWGLQKSIMIKSHYTDEEIALKKKVREMKPLQNNQIVLIDGDEHIVQVLGNYSDCAIFVPMKNF